MVSSKPDLDQVVAAALAEDLGDRYVDVTTSSIIDADLMGEAVVIARKPGVLSGSDAAAPWSPTAPCSWAVMRSLG